MLEESVKKMNIEQLIRYVFIGIIDIFLITIFFRLKGDALAGVSKQFSSLIKEKAWLFMFVPTLGFTHYLLHRFIFFLLYDPFAYIIRVAPWAERGKWWHFLIRFKAFILLDHADKARFVKFRNDHGSDNKKDAAGNDDQKKKRMKKNLSDYLFLRWAAFHYLFMFLESLLIFSVCCHRIIDIEWYVYVVEAVLMMIVIAFGAIPLHLYERKYYKDFLEV